MRCLRVIEITHLDGTKSLSVVIPCGTRRTKERTFKKWYARALRIMRGRYSKKERRALMAHEAARKSWLAWDVEEIARELEPWPRESK